MSGVAEVAEIKTNPVAQPRRSCPGSRHRTELVKGRWQLDQAAFGVEPEAIRSSSRHGTISFGGRTVAVPAGNTGMSIHPIRSRRARRLLHTMELSNRP